MKSFNIKKRFIESSFFKVCSIIKKKHITYLYTIILDLIFLALILFIGKYIGSFIPSDPQQIMALFKTKTNLLLFVIVYPIIFYSFIIFAYSIIKLIILNLVKSLYEKSKFTLKGLGKFYLLNILLFIIFAAAAFVLLLILALVFRQDFVRYFILILISPLALAWNINWLIHSFLGLFIILSLLSLWKIHFKKYLIYLSILVSPILFFLYSTINISHTLFIKNEKKKLIKKGFNIAFSKLSKYGMFLVWDILFVLSYLLVYRIIYLIFKSFVFVNNEAVTAYGPAYTSIFNIISLIFIFLIIAFNRIYFYEKIDKNVLP